MERIYATCAALDGHALLLRGASGSGKSDLALRLIDAGAVLVADDWTDLRVEAGRLIASPPPPLAGLLEVRGLGILRVATLARAPLLMVLDLVERAAVERYPSADVACLLGICVPRFGLDPFDVSAVAKVRLAVGLATGSIMRLP